MKRSFVYYILMLIVFQLEYTLSQEMVSVRIGSLVSLAHDFEAISLGAGFLMFYVSRRLFQNQLHRQILLFSINTIYIACMLLLAFYPVYSAIICLILNVSIGYIGGMVYYNIAITAASLEWGYTMSAVCISAAYLIQWIIQPVIGNVVAMVATLTIGFILISLITFGPAHDASFEDMLPYAKDSAGRSDYIKKRIIRLAVTELMLMPVVAICEITWINNVSQTYMFGFIRLMMVLGWLLVGVLVDKVGWRGAEFLAVCAGVMAIGAVYSPDNEMIRLSLFYLSAALYTAYANIGAWYIAPMTKNPEFWAVFGRVVAISETFFLASKGVSGYWIVLMQITGIILLSLALFTPIPEWKDKEEPEDIKPIDPLDMFKEKYRLTPRETDVVRCLLDSDAPMKEVADELGISERMLYRYMKQLSEKTEAENRAGIIIKYYELAQSELLASRDNTDKADNIDKTETDKDIQTKFKTQT